MKKLSLLLAFCVAVLYCSAQYVYDLKNPVDLINPLMGTDSKPDLSNGNTYPAIALPWGMNFWTPQTGKMGDGWQYQYSADKIRGFKQTHQPSPWMNDYGQFSIMAITGKMRFNQEERASWYSHKSETATPYYYKVYLADDDITAEIAPTERAASFRFTFPKTNNAYIILDAFDKGSYVKIIPAEKKIIGYSTKHSHGKMTSFKNYFVLYFDKAFSEANTWYGNHLAKDTIEYKADHVGAIIGFATHKGEAVNVTVASSFISFEQAEVNLREVGKDNFETVKTKAKNIWNKTLSRVQAEGSTVDNLKTFYSCLYRMLFFPNKLYEKDITGNIIHYSPYNDKVMSGYLFGGTGFWDTFRALYPFLNLVYPDINKEMQQGLINDYKEGGWLPEWSSPGYANVMVGNNSASVVADAYLKGGRGYDIDILYKALLHGANNEGPLDAVGRKGVEFYNKLGYIPYNVNINENAARTLEYAYDDFTIYQLGKALNRPASEIDIYAKRSMNYKNLFDPSVNLMRGKNEDGSFQTPFNPYKWGDAFTEGNSWHYSWSVFHDIAGLSKLMGGRKNFVEMLDTIFTLPPTYDESYYGEVIHEIREMQIANMGQYAHGNQPIQHMIYLYNYAGEPWKTQYWARETMNRMYKATPDGYCGDEDNGQTSAWYVFSAMGFYPVCPATNQYVLGAPLFKKITLHLNNGKQFIINATNNSNINKYVDKAILNGLPYDKNYLNHADIIKGGNFNMSMTKLPNKKKGIAVTDFPYSFSTDPLSPVYKK